MHPPSSYQNMRMNKEFLAPLRNSSAVPARPPIKDMKGGRAQKRVGSVGHSPGEQIHVRQKGPHTMENSDLLFRGGITTPASELNRTTPLS